LRIDWRRQAQGASRIAPGVFALFALVWASAAQALSPAEVYREAANSVVLIFGFEDSGAGSSGTGSIVTADGLVLTNNHVIAQGEDGRRLYPNIMVYFKPNPISGNVEQDLKKPFPVEVIARDPQLDLALLRIKNPPAGLRPIKVGNSEEVDIGENVAAIGHPGGGGMWTLTTGTISSKRRDAARDIFQTDTAINPGNSGGPLLDEHARLVGVNTFVRRVNAQGLPLEGLNYSLRSKLALEWVNRQGVTRIAAVNRADMPAPAPEPAPAPAPVRPSAPVLEESAPEPERAPEPAPAPAPAPRSEPAPAPPPPPEPEAREFTAPDGTRMYGVPNMENDLDEALQYARKEYAEVIEKADKSIREMEEAFDDYDNF
jgi:serine protease Do